MGSLWSSTQIEIKNEPYEQLLHNKETADIAQTIDHFLCLIDTYNDEHQFKYIQKNSRECDISLCHIFNRNIDRNYQYNNDDDQKSIDLEFIIDTARMQIFDKIHCYYHHNNINQYSAKTDKKKQSNELMQRINKKYFVYQFEGNHEVQQLHKDQYCFGYGFYYHDAKNKEDICCNDDITVTKKYSSLSEELTENPICTISMIQFKIEYEKAIIHYKSNYCKETFDKKTFDIEYVLALMIYCNYTELQYKFSKTYRDGFNEQEIHLLHSNFYHLGKRLKLCVHRFGKRINRGYINTFYHGIGEQLFFPSYINQYKKCVIIKSPLSTTSSFAVATNFSNNNNGLIIEFGDNDNSVSPKYFATQWLSDYPNEAECLFIQNETALIINNIVNATNGCEYRMYLDALKDIEHLMTNWYSTELNQEMIIKLFWHQLSRHDTKYESILSLDVYGSRLIETYFNNKQDIKLNCKDIYRYPLLSELLLYDDNKMRQKSGDDMNVNLVMIIKLFPNAQKILITDIPLFYGVILDELIKHCDDIQSDIKLTTLSFKIDVINDYDLILEYEKRLQKYGIKFISRHSIPFIAKQLIRPEKLIIPAWPQGLYTKRINEGLEIYYRHKNRYYDNQFKQFVDEQDYDTDLIIDDIDDTDDDFIDYLYEVWFHDFPTNSIGYAARRETFDVLYECFKDPLAFADKYSQMAKNQSLLEYNDTVNDNNNININDQDQLEKYKQSQKQKHQQKQQDNDSDDNHIAFIG